MASDIVCETILLLVWVRTLRFASLPRLSSRLLTAGDIKFVPSTPDGTARKIFNVSRLAAPVWPSNIGFRSRLAAALDDFLSLAHMFNSRIGLKV